MRIGKTWSTYLQPTQILDTARSYRYSGGNARKLKAVLPLQVGGRQKVLDSGCGTGALTRALRTTYPQEMSLCGIDSDEDFVTFAQSRTSESSSGIAYEVKDSLNTDYDSDSFDAVLSFSLIGHVDADALLSEQIRILRHRGVLICSIISGYRAVRMSDLGLLEPSAEELDFAIATERYVQNYWDTYLHEQWRLWKPQPYELLQQLEKSGLRDCRFDKILLPIVPDNFQKESDFEGALRSLYENKFSIIEIGQRLDDEDANHMAASYGSLLRDRLAERSKLRDRQRVWDYSQTEILVAWGYKGR